MKNLLPKMQHRHAVIIGSMQLHFKLAKTIEEMLRMELSTVQQPLNEAAQELQIHSRLAKHLANQLRVELSYLEEDFHELENFSMELLNLKGSKELDEAELQNA